MGRGTLTPEIQAVAEAHLGREITQQELRLMPYVQHCLMNSQQIEPSRINSEERAILSDWRQAGWLEGGAAHASLYVTKSFWDAIHEILWLGYVNYEG